LVFLHEKLINFRRLVDKLNRMKRVAAGDGVTKCILCGSEFGLLGARSYAAMCHDCKKVSKI